ncbi:hypothetical protein PQ459_11745 [Chryseobacterium sp. KACC 21268]|nr:hypothetical protein PQ459_11745 [Chryseobacterium sp. KACC 21268]
MNYEEALQNKKEQINNADGTIDGKKVYIVPEIREEADAFLQFILRGAIKYSDDLCLKYSSNGKFAIWIDK